MNFKLDPWEGERSGFYGASLAALAIGTAPQGYAKSPEIQENVKGMVGFIQKKAEGEILFNTATALWASSVMPEILTPAQKQAIVAQLLKTQGEDGGWSMNDMGSWKRVDDSTADVGSDGYATGLAVLALKKSGDPAAAKSIPRGMAWLVAHQDKSGMWVSTSVNKKREVKEDNVPGYFMLDAASAMAVLALTN
jgi:squalene-hopene/tetraprenyl-beta-curcumene cyclase